MNSVVKGITSLLAAFAFIPTFSYADSSQHSLNISLHYLGKSNVSGTYSINCQQEQYGCQSAYSPHTALSPKASSPLQNLTLTSYQYRMDEKAQQYGAITFTEQGKNVTIPVNVDFTDINLGERDSELTRSLITAFHPSLLFSAKKELNNETSAADYLAGDKQLSKSMHLFKPSYHLLSAADNAFFKSVLPPNYIALDIGDSYSMIMVFDENNQPSDIYIFDRWWLYRNPLFKTVIGYGDLIGLVLHGIDFARYSGSLLGITQPVHSHAGSSVLNNVIGLGFHVAEIIDHTHGVGEFLSDGLKHYNDHDHSVADQIFGVMHLGHTVYETIAMPSFEHSLQLALTVGSFGYHHIPHRFYEYPLVDAFKSSFIK